MIGAAALSAVLTLAAPAAAGGDGEVAARAVAEATFRLGASGFTMAGAAPASDSACDGGLADPAALAPIPGETGREASQAMLFQADADAAPELGELVTVGVILVEPADQEVIAETVARLGQPDTASCRRDEVAAAIAESADLEEVTADVEAAAIDDLGIGDASARLDVGVRFAHGADAQVVTYTHLAAQQGRALAMIKVVTFGDGPGSEFDFGEELASLLATAAG